MRTIKTEDAETKTYHIPEFGIWPYLHRPVFRNNTNPQWNTLSSLKIPPTEKNGVWHREPRHHKGARITGVIPIHSHVKLKWCGDGRLSLCW
jgi:hypothetical protein